MGILLALSAVYIILTLDDWTKTGFHDYKGNYVAVELDTGLILFLNLLKFVMGLICLRWGYLGLKVFKPIIKE